MKKLDIVYEDTGRHLEKDDICYFTTFRIYYDKLNLSKYNLKTITVFTQESNDRDYDVFIMEGKVDNILKAYDEIEEYDFYSEEPVAMFYQNPLEGI